MVNTSLEPLEPEQCKELPKTKMTKALQNAWKIASENHDLDYFKSILKTWQEEEATIEKEVREEEERLRKEAEERAIQEAADAEMAEAEEPQAKKKAKSRKSKGGDDDVDMEDADAPKSSKKRKKDGDSDAEGKVSFRSVAILSYANATPAKEDTKGYKAERTEDTQWRDIDEEVRYEVKEEGRAGAKGGGRSREDAAHRGGEACAA